ncbi:hypothetical protein Tco_0691848, partial [Tanacetum coccineum]
ESWNDPRDFAKLVKAIALPQDVQSTSDRRLIELKNQWSPRHSVLHGNPKQAFVEYASSRTDEAGGTLPSDTVKNPKLGTHPVSSARSYQTIDPQCSSHPSNSINAIKAHFKEAAIFPKQGACAQPRLKPNHHKCITQKEPEPTHEDEFQDLHLNLTVLEVLAHAPIYNAILDKYIESLELVCSKEDDGEVMFIEIIRNDDEPYDEGPNEGEGATTEEPVVESFDTFPTRDELTYHRIKGMHVFVGNFTYVVEFMIVEDISLIIDHRLSQVVLWRPFVEISNMTHDPPEGVVRFIRGANEVAYKMPHKIEQYDSLLGLEKEHTISVYLRNEEDRRIGVEYVMSKILGFYKECLELGPEYLTGLDDEGEVT